MNWQSCHPESINSIAPRWGQAIVATQRSLYIIGGYKAQSYLGDFWKLDIETNQMRQLTLNASLRFNSPLARSNHSAIHYDNSIYIFGGASSSKTKFNDCLKLNLKTNRVTALKTTGAAPEPRTYHAATLVDKYMIVIGGEGEVDLNDLWALDLEEKVWTKLRFEGDKFTARRFHTAVTQDNKVYVFGGCHDEYSYDFLNEVVELDFTSFVEGWGSEIDTKVVRATGEVPMPRWGHSASIYEGKMYVFGGRNCDDLNDFFAFDTATYQWEQLDCANAPVPRRRHSSGFVGRCMFVFGGFDGVFYNDLQMINVHPFKVVVPKCSLKADIAKMVNNSETANITFKVGRNRDLVYAHKSLILNQWGSSISDTEFFFKKVSLSSPEVSIEL